MRTEVKRDKIREFMDELGKVYFRIDSIYNFDLVYDITFGVELMGYAEPVIFYEKIKNFVVDLWYMTVGDTNLHRGHNMPEKWLSCKKEVGE